MQNSQIASSNDSAALHGSSQLLESLEHDGLPVTTLARARAFVLSSRGLLIAATASALINICGLIPASTIISEGDIRPLLVVIFGVVVSFSLILANKSLLFPSVVLILSAGINPALAPALAFLIAICGMRGQRWRLFLVSVAGFVAIIFGLTLVETLGLFTPSPGSMFAMLTATVLAFTVAALVGIWLETAALLDQQLVETRIRLIRYDQLEAQTNQQNSRMCMARTLHDEVSSKVALISLHASVLENEISRQEQSASIGFASVKLIQQSSVEAMHALGKMLEQLSKPAPNVSTFPEFAIQEVLDLAVLNAQSLGYEMKFEDSQELSFENTNDFAYFFHEAFTNAFKYAPIGSKIISSVVFDEFTVTAQVSNDVSVNLQHPHKRIRMGLQNLREYAHLHGGFLHVEEGKNNNGGNAFIVTMTLPREEEYSQAIS